MTVDRPSDAPQTAAASPAGPAPMTMRSRIPCGAPDGGRPTTRASSALLGLRSTLVLRPDHHRGLVRRHAEPLEQRLGGRVVLQVDPGVRYPVAGGELPQPPGVRRVPRTDDPDAGHRPDERVPPADEG